MASVACSWVLWLDGIAQNILDATAQCLGSLVGEFPQAAPQGDRKGKAARLPLFARPGSGRTSTTSFFWGWHGSFVHISHSLGLVGWICTVGKMSLRYFGGPLARFHARLHAGHWKWSSGRVPEIARSVNCSMGARWPQAHWTLQMLGENFTALPPSLRPGWLPAFSRWKGPRAGP